VDFFRRLEPHLLFRRELRRGRRLDPQLDLVDFFRRLEPHLLFRRELRRGRRLDPQLDLVDFFRRLEPHLLFRRELRRGRRLDPQLDFFRRLEPHLLFRRELRRFDLLQRRLDFDRLFFFPLHGFLLLWLDFFSAGFFSPLPLRSPPEESPMGSPLDRFFAGDFDLLRFPERAELRLLPFFEHPFFLDLDFGFFRQCCFTETGQPESFLPSPEALVLAAFSSAFAIRRRLCSMRLRAI